MRFRRNPRATEAGISRHGAWRGRTVELDGDVVLWCEPVGVLRHVLGRLTRAVAAGSHFTITGAESFYAINDAVSSYAERAAEDHVVVAIRAQKRQLELEGGPFLYDIAGGNEAQGAAIQPTVEQGSLGELVDAISFEPLDGHGVLRLTIRDHGRD